MDRPERILHIQHWRPLGRTDSNENMFDLLCDLLPAVKRVEFDSAVLHAHDKRLWDPLWEDHQRMTQATHALMNIADVEGLGIYHGIGQSKANFGNQTTIPTKSCGLTPLRFTPIPGLPPPNGGRGAQRIAAGETGYVEFTLPEDGEYRLYYVIFKSSGGRVRFATVRSEDMHPGAGNSLAMKTAFLPAGGHKIEFHSLETRHWVLAFTAEADAVVEVSMITETNARTWTKLVDGRPVPISMEGPVDADTPPGWWEFKGSEHIALRSPEYGDLEARELAHGNLDGIIGEYGDHRSFRGFSLNSDEPNGVGQPRKFQELFTSAGHGYAFDIARIAKRARGLAVPEPVLFLADREQDSNGAMPFDRMNSVRNGCWIDTHLEIPDEAYLHHVLWNEPFSVNEMARDLDKLKAKPLAAGIYMDYPQQTANWRAAQAQSGIRVQKEFYFSWDPARFTEAKLREVISR